MTGQELVSWCGAYAVAHPFEAAAIVVLGFVCARQMAGAPMILPDGVEELREKRGVSQSAARAVDAAPTDRAKKDGPWTR